MIMMMLVILVMCVVVPDEIDSEEEDACMDTGQNRGPRCPLLYCRHDFKDMQDTIQSEYELSASDQEFSNRSSNRIEHQASPRYLLST